MLANHQHWYRGRYSPPPSPLAPDTNVNTQSLIMHKRAAATVVMSDSSLKTDRCTKTHTDAKPPC